MTETVTGTTEPEPTTGRGAGAWSTALRVATLLTALLTVAVVARTQGEDRFGSWTVAVAVVSGLLILDLGLGNVLVRTSGRLAASGRAEEVPGLVAAARRYAALRISAPTAVIGVVAAAVVLATGATLGDLDTIDLSTTVLALGLVSPALALLYMAPRARIGLGQVTQSSRLGILGCVVQVVVVVVGVRARVPLGLLVAANFTSQLVGWGLDTLVVRRSAPPGPTVTLDPALVRDGRRYQVLVISGFAGFNADAILVGAIVGPAAAGLVALAARVVLTPSMVVTSWFTPRWGTVARTEVHRPEDVRSLVLRTVLWAGGVSAAASVTAGVLAGPLVRIIAGPGFEVPSDVVWATVPAGVVLGVAAALAVALNGLGLVAEQLRLGVASALVNLALGVVLCVRLGAVGAPLATAVAHGLIGIPMSVLAVRERLRTPHARVGDDRGARP